MGISGGFFKGEGDMKKTTYDPNDDGVVAVAQTEANMVKPADLFVHSQASNTPKKASADLRTTHSYDGSRAPDASVWAKVASFVITNGMKGHIRSLVDLSSSHNAVAAEVKIVVNGSMKGQDNEVGMVHPTYQTNSMDCNLGELAAGDEIELHIRSGNNAHTVYAKLWKIHYDNDLPVALATTEG